MDQGVAIEVHLRVVVGNALVARGGPDRHGFGDLGPEHWDARVDAGAGFDPSGEAAHGQVCGVAGHQGFTWAQVVAFGVAQHAEVVVGPGGDAGRGGEKPAAEVPERVASVLAESDLVALMSGFLGENHQQFLLEAGQRVPVRIVRVEQVEPVAQGLGDLPPQAGPHPQPVVAAGFDHGGNADLVRLGGLGGHEVDPVLAGGEVGACGQGRVGGERAHRCSPSVFGVGVPG
ncbi:hypothetical protein [Amycolatopsis taiwanensis]|nr:hypothetical protein [Amycolatopsis taiwanensis]